MELADAVAQYRAATEELVAAARAVGADDLDRHPGGEWSTRQIVHHLADAEAESYLRLRRLLVGPEGTAITAWDEAAWAASDRLGYAQRPVENALSLVAALRATNAEVLARMDDADLSRWGEHTQFGRYSVSQWLEIYTRHARDHARQIVEAAGA
ncbi:MAG: DinB family protein [Acidimicrobiales bacterium]